MISGVVVGIVEDNVDPKDESGVGAIPSSIRQQDSKYLGPSLHTNGWRISRNGHAA